MSFTAILSHYFLPHHTNNHRARLLHPLSFSFLILAFLFIQVSLPFLSQASPVVLGYSAKISPDEIVALTNQKRTEAGLPALKVNSLLTKAALAKAADMLARDYWAHQAPDGTQPWYFFIQAGYQYKYAGENLARDFSESSSVVDAWIASPSHRDNLLSPKYEEIGVAVVEGELNKVETTLVVQFFGTTMASSAALSTSQEQPQQVLAGVKNENLIRVAPVAVFKSFAAFVIILFIVLFTIDILIVRQRNVARVSSHGIAHLLFLIMILVAVLAVKSGVII